MNHLNRNRILQKHSDWLNDIKGGVKADLSGADLSDANLIGVNLRGADLEDANLYGANLNDADLENADLRCAKGIIHWQSPVGIKRTCYSVKHDNCVMHKLGCFYGNTEKAVTAIRKKYGDNSMYEQLLLLNAKALQAE
jgi:hypothetical protein